ncbi:MAG: hypothetical protein ABJG78_12770 [Cyclobacteriaceae bacterium]
MTKTIATLLFSTLLLSGFSQQQTNLLASDAFRAMGDQPSFGMMQTKKNTEFGISGTHYFKETLSPGKIKMFKNERYIEGLKIRYNIFYEMLEVVANEVFFAAENEQISDFVIQEGETTHHFYNSTLYAGDLLPLGYIRMIHMGDEISVFAKDIKKEKKHDSSEPYSSIKNEIEYLDEIDYYIYEKSSKDFIEVKSRKKLVDRFPVLENFAVTKSNLKKESFLAEMAVYMNKQSISTTR